MKGIPMRLCKVSLVIVCAMICTFGLPAAMANDIHWYGIENQTEAVNTMKRENRPMLIYLTTTGCYYCKKMKKETYCNPEVAAEINKSFVPIELHKYQAKSLVKKLGIQTYPTTVVVSPKFKVLDRITGYLSAKKFKQRLDRVRKQIAQR